ncbi:MAG: rod shape-determining protein MreD [Lachnospiraceae bacterium]|nr:rod shape-determining protein MreD [Lachnospiraceae bacterium]
MKKVIVTAMLVLVCFLLQSSVFPWFSFGGIIPNLLIILTVSFGLMSGEITGILTGFFCGLLMDMFSANGGGTGSGDILGFYALIYMFAGYFNGKCNRLFYPEDIKLPLLMITATDLSVNFICYVIMFLLRAKLDIGFYLLHIILPEAVYTLIIASIFYPLLLLINRKISKAERGSADIN